MRETRFVLIDDIDGTPAQETVRFSVGRQHYEIDLSSQHLREFNEALERWIKPARKVSGRRSAKGVVVGGTGNDALLIRAWAKENNIDLAERGRIPLSVREAYYARANG